MDANESIIYIRAMSYEFPLENASQDIGGYIINVTISWLGLVITPLDHPSLHEFDELLTGQHWQAVLILSKFKAILYGGILNE